MEGLHLQLNLCDDDDDHDDGNADGSQTDCARALTFRSEMVAASS